MKKAIFLDFDGVLFDTAKEGYVLSLLALERTEKISEIDFNSQEFNLFNKYRYLVGPAWNYYYLLKAIAAFIENNRIDVDKESRAYINNAKREDYLRFEQKYFEIRKYLSENYFEAWLKLNTPYKFLDKMRPLILGNKGKIYIITTKDKPTIMRLFSINNINFPPEYIFDKSDYEKISDKGSLVADIMQKNKIIKALFIDDNREHLMKCARVKNLTLLQPEWGYITPGDHVDSEDHILALINEYL